MKRHNIFYLAMLLFMSVVGLTTNTASAQSPACYNITQQVWICSGGTFMLNGQNITTEGVYVDSLHDVNGCDSVVTYYVNKAPSYHTYETAVISDQSGFPWHGDTYYKTGEYEKVYKTAKYDCDSIFHLTLTVYPTYRIYDTLHLCTSDFPYRYDSRLTIPGIGDYASTYKTIHGYDSIYYVHVEKIAPVVTQMQMTMCEGSSLVSPSGKVIKEAGTYADTLRTAAGCDSIVQIVVNTIPHFFIVDYVSISAGNSYLWHGNEYSSTGIYSDVHTSQLTGCDSIYELQLTVFPTYHFHDTLKLCTSALPYTYHGISCPSAGDYDATFKTVHGYDSIYSLHLDVQSATYSHQTVTICSGETVTLPDGSIQSAPGTYPVTIQTADGCDSVVYTTVKVLPSYIFDEKAIFAQGGSFNWRNKTFDQPGVYFDSLPTALGCDSIYRLTLLRQDSMIYLSEATVCQSELPYTSWRGRSLYESGVYEDHYQTANGADSIFRLKLTVNPVKFSSRQVQLCDGDVYNFHGLNISSDTIVSDTLHTADGCDSICTYVINFATAYLFESHATLHGQASYKWRNQTYSTPGIYENVFSSLTTGCDSIYRLVLHSNPIINFEESDTICQSDAPYVWRGKNYYRSGNYYDSIGSVYGADTVYHLTLIVNPTHITESAVDVCSGQTFTFNGQSITTSQICEAKLISHSGCDSIVRVVVNFIPTYVHESEVSISDRQTYSWRGRTLSSSGIYEERATAPSGCDSVFKLHLNVYPTYEFNERVVICQADAPYDWQNRQLSVSGIYSVTYPTVNGYDSVYTLNLTINQNGESTRYLELCDGDSYDFYGQNITTPDVYEETIHTTAGCDSTIYLVVNPAPSYHKREYAEICEGGTYSWRGQTGLTAPGEYDASMHSSTGCDSTFHLTLNTAPSYQGIQNLYFCQGESVDYNGTTYTAPGDYTNTFVTAAGCDSTVRVIVHLADRYYFYDTLHLANNMTTTWHGQTINAAGTYYDYGRTAQGCDSTYQLLVIMRNTYHFEDYAEICAGESFPWRGANYSANGVYNIVGQTIDGQDSIYTLHLTVHPKYEHITSVVDICEGESFTLRDTTVTRNSVLSDTLKTIHGCDSIVKVVVRFNAGFTNSASRTIREGDSFTWHGQTISAPGRYYDRHENVAHCDSIYELIVDLSRDYKFTEHLTLCQNEADTFHWHINGVNYKESGVYYHKLRTVANDADSIYELNLTVHPTYIVDEHYNICEGEILRVHGYAISNDTLCYDTLYSSHGCDSIVRISVAVNPSYRFEKYATFNQGGTYNWVGHSHTIISHPGVYFDSLTSTVTGCDSIYVLTLDYNKSYSFREDTTLCESDMPLIWHGREYWTSGTFYDSLYTTAGADSVFTLNLVVNPVYKSSRTVEICEGNSYVYKGIAYSKDTVISDTLHSSLGCDSIEFTHINVARSYRFIEERVIAADSVLKWQGKSITTAGTHLAVYTSVVSGCDSIYELHLTISPDFFQHTDTVVCENDLPVHWHGHDLWQANTYYDSLRTVAGSDSVYSLTLKINPVYRFTDQVNVCHGGTAYYNDSVITKTSVFYDTLQTVEGCDSIRKVVYNFLPKYHFVEEHVIAEDSVLNWRGRNYDIEGTYYDSYSSLVSGCDSVYELRLKVSRGFYLGADTVVCKSETPFLWHGINIDTTGYYYDSLKSVMGADSVYRIKVTVNPVFEVSDQIIFCSGETAYYNGTPITKTTTFSDTLRSVNGCDSIRKVVYNFLPKYHFIENHTIAEDSVLHWHGSDYHIEGTYFDAYSSRVSGCDSIYELRLHVSREFYLAADTVVCQSETPFLWHGQNITKSGFYYDSLRTVAGADSVYHFNVVVNPSFIFTDQVNVCHGDFIRYKDSIITKTSVFYDTLRSVNGCDSIRKVVYNVLPKYHVIEDHVIAADSVLRWHGREYNVDGTYFDAYSSVIGGCDSIYELRLHVSLGFYHQTDTVVCQSETPFVWHGRYISETGYYYDSLKNVAGSDSVYRINVKVNPTSLFTEQLNFCEGDVAYYRNAAVTRTSVFYDTLRTIDGCDSIRKVVYNFSSKFYVIEDHVIASDSALYWHGNYYNVDGTYFDANTSLVTGCDSIYELRLHVSRGFYHQADTVVCQSETPFLWHDRYISETGYYYDSLKNVAGSDSVYRINVKVNPTYIFTEQINVCHGDIVYYRDSLLTRTSTFSDTLRTIDGCDSIRMMVYNFLPDYHFIEEHIITADSVLRWHGHDYSIPGTYFDPHTSYIGGCDSIYELHLIVSEGFYHQADTTVCENDLPLLWHNRYIEQAGTYYDSLKNVAGSDSVYRITVKVNKSFEMVDQIDFCAGDTAYYRGDTITKTTVFTDTLFSVNGCDSLRTVIYNFNPTYYFTEEHTICSDSNFVWHGRLCNVDGTYWDAHTTATGCDSIYELRLHVNTATHDGKVVAICKDSLPYTFIYEQDTIILWRDTTILYSFKTACGCDSLYEFTLQFTDKCSPVDSIPLCPGDSVWVFDKWYSQPGPYSLEFNTNFKNNYPDSLYRFYLYPAKTYFFEEEVEICSVELPYKYHDRFLYRDTVLYDTLKTVEGCDSVFRLNFVVHNTPLVKVIAEICEGDVYNFRGKNYSEVGIFYDTLHTVDACDSIFRIVLNRAPSYFIDEKVQFAEGQSYNWHNKVISVPGIYFDSLTTTVSQCDSIYRLTATMARSFYHFDSIHVCDNHLPYEWHGKLIYKDGLFHDSLKGHQGNDSVYAIRIVVDKAYYSSQVLELNDNASYLWRGTTITAPGEYFDTLRTSCNCDSVFHLIVNKQSLSEIPITEQPVFICEGEVYTFRGMRITTDTVIYDTLLTSTARDSIIRYVITQRPTILRERFASIPDNDSYDFFGTPVNSNGIYYHHVPYAGMSDCDSLVVKLTLTVYPTHYKEQKVDICAEHTPYIYNNKEIYHDTTIVDTLRTIDGYDSIVVTKLSVHGTIEPTVIPVTLCDGDVLRLRSGDYYEPGNYYDTLLSIVTGCDSVIHYIVNKGQTYHIYENATFCENGSYTWRGHHSDTVLTRPGLYYDSLISVVSQCDSIYYLNLEPKGVYRLDTTVLVCYDELPYQYNGHFYYDSREFTDTLTSYSCGCDSILHYKFQLTNKCSEYELRYRCTNDTFYVGSIAVSSSGTYRFPHWTAVGFDSVQRMHVQDVPIYRFEENRTICEGDSIIFYDMVCKSNRTYTKRFESVYGCDSIYALNLTVNSVYRNRTDITFDTIADYQLPYHWHGSFINASGIYYDTLSAVTQCDSILTLRLKVYPTDTVIVERSICRGETLIYNDTAYTESVRKTYLSNYRAVGYSRCIIFDLSVVDTTRLLSVTLDEPCADAAELSLTPKYTGATPAFYTVRFLEQKAVREGFTDLIEEPYTGAITIPVPTKQAGYYVTPGYYKIRLSLSNGICAFQPLDTTLLIRYPSSVMHQKWNNVVALYKAAKNGNYNFIDYSWEVLDKNITAPHSAYLYSDLLEVGDRVVVNLTRSGDTRPVPSCPLTIQPYDPGVSTPILLAPSRVPRTAPVTTLEAASDGTYRIYDSTGRLIRQQSFEKGKQDVEMPSTAGFYMVHIELDNMATPDGIEIDAKPVTERVLVY